MKLTPVILGTAVLLVAFGIPGVNIYHHVELPTLNKYRIISHYTYSPLFSKHWDITLEDEIRNAALYSDISKVLREANYGDTITFHLAGYGGAEQTTYLLINQIHGSKAEVTMSVEAPVYSAHAYLAVSGDKLVIYPYTWLMFHFSSILNDDCSKKDGADRRVSNKEHCQAFKDADIDLGNKLIDSTDILTFSEKQSIKTGHDVYLEGKEVMKRLNKDSK
jgi:hypothetical protein